MRQVVIENPVLNSPYSEPTRHFKFDEEGITNEIVQQRRISAYFVPVARPCESASVVDPPPAPRNDPPQFA